MWRESQAGEWYWPLHPERQQDHLRVWSAARSRDLGVEWQGALVLDGDYLEPTRVVPYATADDAKVAVHARAMVYLLILSTSLSLASAPSEAP